MAAIHSAEIAAAAARLIVEDGMEYGPAKRRAARDLIGSRRVVELPGNDVIEEEVRAYLDCFHADSQPAELAALRRIAITWMERLDEFRPYLGGAVWRGTATRRSSIHIDLFCDDSKAAEIALIDQHVAYEVGAREGLRGGEVDVLHLMVAAPELGGPVHLALAVHDWDDLRGALRADPRGRPWRGDLAAVRALAAAPP